MGVRPPAPRAKVLMLTTAGATVSATLEKLPWGTGIAAGTTGACGPAWSGVLWTGATAGRGRPGGWRRLPRGPDVGAHAAPPRRRGARARSINGRAPRTATRHDA